MSDRHGDYPEDEPVIGATYPPPPPPPAGEGYIGGSDSAPYDVLGAVADDWDGEEGYDDEYDEYDDEYDADSYYDGYEDDVAPARQPLFYVFVALAALVGGSSSSSCSAS